MEILTVGLDIWIALLYESPAEKTSGNGKQKDEDDHSQYDFHHVKLNGEQNEQNNKHNNGNYT